MNSSWSMPFCVSQLRTLMIANRLKRSRFTNETTYSSRLAGLRQQKRMRAAKLGMVAVGISLLAIVGALVASEAGMPSDQSSNNAAGWKVGLLRDSGPFVHVFSQ